MGPRSYLKVSTLIYYTRNVTVAVNLNRTVKAEILFNYNKLEINMSLGRYNI